MARVLVRPSLGRPGIVRTVGPPPALLRIAAILVVPVFLYALFLTGQKALENYQLAVQAQQLRQNIYELRQENMRLQKQLDTAKSDASIEYIAREQLGLVKPGDHSLLVLDGSVRPTAPPGALPAPPATPPVWQQWWNYFFGPDPTTGGPPPPDSPTSTP